MWLVVASAGALVICGCFNNGASPAGVQPPLLSRNVAEQVMLQADDVKRSAFESRPASRLADAFRSRALQRLDAQSQAMIRRGWKVEERNMARTLVFWDPLAGEAVIQVTAQRRIVTPDELHPAWASTVWQWWARLQYAEGSWWVVDQRDLPPDQWYAATGGEA
jgi:hypothetical protein